MSTYPGMEQQLQNRGLRFDQSNPASVCAPTPHSSPMRDLEMAAVSPNALQGLKSVKSPRPAGITSTPPFNALHKKMMDHTQAHLAPSFVTHSDLSTRIFTLKRVREDDDDEDQQTMDDTRTVNGPLKAIKRSSGPLRPHSTAATAAFTTPPFHHHNPHFTHQPMSTYATGDADEEDEEEVVSKPRKMPLPVSISRLPRRSKGSTIAPPAFHPHPAPALPALANAAMMGGLNLGGGAVAEQGTGGGHGQVALTRISPGTADGTNQQYDSDWENDDGLRAEGSFEEESDLEMGENEPYVYPDLPQEDEYEE